MSEDFDWTGAPEGERYLWDGFYRYVINGDRVWVLNFSPRQWMPSLYDGTPDELRGDAGKALVRVDDLHPLVPGQEAIDWADELLRDPEVAGWTEAWIDNNTGVAIQLTDGLCRYRHREGRWVSTDAPLGTDTPYRSSTATANTNEDKEETVATEFETYHCTHGKKKLICGYSEKMGREWAGYACSAGSLPECKIEMIALDGSKALDELREKLAQAHAEHEQFKARVYKVGKAAAIEHTWCGVFDELMDELGIKKPKVEWPKPGTLFRVPGVWDTDTIGMVLPDQKYRFVRDCGRPATGTTVWPLDDFDDVSGLVILDV